MIGKLWPMLISPGAGWEHQEASHQQRQTYLYWLNWHCHWKTGSGKATLKEDRYMELTMDLHQKRYKVWFFTFKIGSRGVVIGQSTYTILRNHKATKSSVGTVSQASQQESSQWSLQSSWHIAASPPMRELPIRVSWQVSENKAYISSMVHLRWWLSSNSLAVQVVQDNMSRTYLDTA